MNPITLTAIGSLDPQFYQCGDCKAVYHLINKGLADQCCSPAMLKCMREGCEERKEKNRTMCKKHGDEHFKGDKEFAEACQAFEDANKMHYLYGPDYTKKLAVDAIPGNEDEDERMLTRQECEKQGMVFGTDEELRNI